MAIEYTKTIRGITYTQGQSFKARVAGTWYASSDGTGASGSIAKGHTCYFQFYQADYDWQTKNYCINPNASGASEYEWTTIDIFPYATYTVSYNANGGSGAPANQTKTWGTNLTLSSTKPTRTGYTFKGWGTSASATTATYQAGGTYTANASITLYAVWQINTYTVSYNANGGSGAPAAQTKTYNVDLTLRTGVPTRSTYIFKGWATSASGDVAYSAGGTYKANASVTLYAVWEAIAPIVTQTATVVSSTKINLSATSDASCLLWRYKLDGGSYVTFSETASTSASGSITVSAGTHTLRTAAKRVSNGAWGYSSTQTIDTAPPTVIFTVSNIETNSFRITAAANVNCNQWWYSLDGGNTWISYSTTNATSTTVTVTDLDVNTTYNVNVRAKKTSNNIIADSTAQSISTQGGIMHLKVSGAWKDAIPYVKVGLAWKQAICYTKIGSSWRINT